MIHVLSQEAREVIRDVARRRAPIAFDFDGTLAPIVEHPAEAGISARTRGLLRTAAHLFPCAIVSGRARADLAARLPDLPVVALVGNHGAEGDDAPPPASVRAQVRAWAAALSEVAGGEGIEVEEKGFTVAVHYRRAPDPADARRRVLRLASVLPGARVFGGTSVVNVTPIGASTKGDALESFALRFPAAPMLYVGDDDADEDAFRSLAVTYPIRIGRSDGTAARYYLDEQREIDALLWALVAERARVAGVEDRWHELDPALKPEGFE